MTQTNEFKNEEWRKLYHLGFHRDKTPMYECSSLGRIRMKVKDGYKEIHPTTNPWGYSTVSLINSVFVRQTLYVHRLVAVLFVENPAGYDTVDHIDGDKSNNCKDNLRWVSRGKNISLGHASGAITHSKPKRPVKLSHPAYNRELCFESLTKAALFLGVSVKAILSGLQGHFKPKGWTVSPLNENEINGNLFTDEDFN